MEKSMNAVGQAGFTWGAYLMSNWTELGAAALMILQAILLLMKITDRWKGRKEEEKDE